MCKKCGAPVRELLEQGATPESARRAAPRGLELGIALVATAMFVIGGLMVLRARSAGVALSPTGAGLMLVAALAYLVNRAAGLWRRF